MTELKLANHHNFQTLNKLDECQYQRAEVILFILIRAALFDQDIEDIRNILFINGLLTQQIIYPAGGWLIRPLLHS
ncbi:MAG TPA: hypothetical protein P5260_04120 [Candidatus Competibacter sp.]|nr:hypothetical protein [Candidatus Competibacter sp.]